MAESNTFDKKPDTLYGQIVDFCWNRLGGPTWDIELTKEQWDSAIQEAIQYYGRYLGFERKMLAIQLEGQKFIYELPRNEIFFAYEQIEDIFFDYDHTLIAGADPRSLAYMSLLGEAIAGPGLRGAFFEYYSVISMLKDIKLNFATDLSWKIQGNNSILIVPGSMQFVQGIMLIQYKKYPQLHTVERVWWIKRYSLSILAEMLLMNRGKFGGAMTAPHAISMDLSALQRLATNEKEKLEKQLRQWQVPDVEIIRG